MWPARPFILAVLLQRGLSQEAGGLQEVSSLDDECEAGGDCAFYALQTRGVKGSDLPSLGAPLMSHDIQMEIRQSRPGEIVSKVLDHFFITVKGPGAFMEETIANKHNVADSTWKLCTSINYTHYHESQEEFFSNWRKHHPGQRALGTMDLFDVALKFAPFAVLGIDHMCGHLGFAKYDPTCFAVRATLASSRALRLTMSDGPRFANYTVVDWGQSPSWIDGAVTDVDRSAVPPSAKVVDSKGVIGYFLCDAARTVFTQSPNQQQRGTCSFTASLAALSRRAPAWAAKIALRLFWTGKPATTMPDPCPDIYEQQPGLVPFKDFDGTVYPRDYEGSTEAPCDSRVFHNCSSQGDGPIQSPGLQYMWTQSLISSWIRNSWVSCNNQGQPKAILNFPGRSQEEFEAHLSSQGGSLASMLWICQHVIDPVGKTCEAVFNFDICLISDEDCMDFTTLPVEPGLLNVYGDATEEEQPKMRDAYPLLAEYDDMMYRIESTYPNDTFPEGFSPGTAFPSFTEDLLYKVCEADVAFLLVVEAALIAALNEPDEFARLKDAKLPYYGTSGREPWGTCDHAVFLDNCDMDKDAFYIWSRAVKIKLHKAVLLGAAVDRNGTASRSNGTFNSGIVCGAVVAHQMTREPAHFGYFKHEAS
eukprot:TRINITY_DN80951_c0_g1_i1.p1 TRINITY_DN80951_c0_g1~~TRINITY_DN80951_c0_g1_i1.p1  ORF type:complete len:646 (-),score=82.34 TRINITY_DN80951_c0_g1_i1:63-2000(-)